MENIITRAIETLETITFFSRGKGTRRTIKAQVLGIVSSVLVPADPDDPESKDTYDNEIDTAIFVGKDPETIKPVIKKFGFDICQCLAEGFNAMSKRAESSLGYQVTLRFPDVVPEKMNAVRSAILGMVQFGTELDEAEKLFRSQKRFAEFTRK